MACIAESTGQLCELSAEIGVCERERERGWGGPPGDLPRLMVTFLTKASFKRPDCDRRERKTEQLIMERESFQHRGENCQPYQLPGGCPNPGSPAKCSNCLISRATH